MTLVVSLLERTQDTLLPERLLPGSLTILCDPVSLPPPDPLPPSPTPLHSQFGFFTDVLQTLCDWSKVSTEMERKNLSFYRHIHFFSLMTIWHVEFVLSSHILFLIT